jgi:hypothetical protein
VAQQAFVRFRSRWHGQSSRCTVPPSRKRAIVRHRIGHRLLALHELHQDVIQFLENRIDTVPHMEALMLLWENRASSWRLEQIAARLYVSTDAAASIMEDLSRRRLVRAQQNENDATYSYDDGWDERGDIMKAVAMAYRRQLLQVTSLIHSKPSTAVRDFARAFRLKKD